MTRQLLAIGMLVLGGCLTGVGPTIGVRTTHEISLGWEASSSVMGTYWNSGAQVGQSFPLGPRRATTYVAGQVYRLLHNGPDRDTDAYLGASLGFAGGEGGARPYASLWPMGLTGERSCVPEGPVFTIQVGVRWIAGSGELYVAPKINRFSDYCLR
jgi:hypothetical protein